MRQRVLLFAVVVMLGFAAGLCAQDQQPPQEKDQPRMPMIVGTIVKADKDTLVVKRDSDGQEATYTLTADTKITKALVVQGPGVPATVDDLKPGKSIYVQYKPAEGEGKNPVVVFIRIRPEGA